MPTDASARDPRDRQESPTVVATRLGLLYRKTGSGDTISWARLLDLASIAYWERRKAQREAS